MVEGLRREATHQIPKQPSPCTPHTTHTTHTTYTTYTGNASMQLTETVPMVVKELWLVLRDTAYREGGRVVGQGYGVCVNKSSYDGH